MSAVEVWTVIIVLGLGTFLIRLSFLGLLGTRTLPGWLVRCLRYTAVAMLPALAVIARDLGATSDNQRQLIVAVFLFGVGIGWIAFAPLKGD